MGIRGAAIATVIAQILSAFAGFYYFASGKNSIKIHLKNLALKWKTIKNIFTMEGTLYFRHVCLI